MRGVVQSRPFTKSSKKTFLSSKRLPFPYGRKRGKDQYHSFFPFFFQKWGVIVLIIILSLFLVIFLLKGTWYNPTYLIQKIEYSQETRKKYNNTELFVLASEFLRGKYYNALRVGGESELLDWVKTEYPFVSSAKIHFLGNQSIRVDFDFQEPDFLVKLGEKKFGIWKNGFSNELDPSWSLSRTGFIIDTPQYLTGTVSLSGFFHEVEYERYQKYLPAIHEAFPKMTRFVYLAGSPSFVVFEEEKMIFLYKDNPLHQLQKLAWIQKYYQDYDKLKTIDLGSLTQEKVIVGH